MTSRDGIGTSSWHFTTSWAAEVVTGIRMNSERAKAELYARMGTGIKSYLRRQLSLDHVDDLAHNVYIATLSAIEAGRLREPEKLPGYVMTIARRQAMEAISQAQKDRNTTQVDTTPILDNQPNPEERLGSARRIELMKKALADLTLLDRDILVRWYLLEQSTAKICSETGLTEKQVSNRKHRAVLKLRSRIRKELTPLQSSAPPLAGGMQTARRCALWA